MPGRRRNAPKRSDREFPEELARLRALQARGEALLTEELVQTHRHLGILRGVLAGREGSDDLEATRPAPLAGAHTT